jgi:hypothetical protein
MSGKWFVIYWTEEPAGGSWPTVRSPCRKACSWTAKGMNCSCQNLARKRDRFGCHETDCCAHGRRHDYVNDSCPDSRSHLFCLHEGARASGWHAGCQDKRGIEVESNRRDRKWVQRGVQSRLAVDKSESGKLTGNRFFEIIRAYATASTR